jgi:hypothetical protein
MNILSRGISTGFPATVTELLRVIGTADVCRPAVAAYARHDKPFWIRTDDLTPDQLRELDGGDRHERHEANTDAGYSIPHGNSHYGHPRNRRPAKAGTTNALFHEFRSVRCPAFRRSMATVRIAESRI